MTVIFPLVKDKLEFLLFTWETRNFRLENQLARAISFRNLQKIWAVIGGDAIFLPVQLILIYFVAGRSLTWSNFSRQASL